MHRHLLGRTCALLTALLALAGCGGTETSGDAGPGASDSPAAAPDDELAGLRREVIEGYADGVAASYAASLASAGAMDTAVDVFVADPSEESLEAAKQAWLTARDDYGPTETFRFYGGPIDDEEVLATTDC